MLTIQACDLCGARLPNKVEHCHTLTIQEQGRELPSITAVEFCEACLGRALFLAIDAMCLPDRAKWVGLIRTEYRESSTG